jgi:hypothetical protein
VVFVLASAFFVGALAKPPSDSVLREAAELVAVSADDKRIVVIGELHGTNEMPALAGELLRLHAEARRPAMLALEIHVDEQERIDAFLGSPGAAADRATLLDGPFWTVPPERNDGRRSVATLALLEEVRALRAGGADVSVVAIDAAIAGEGPDRRNERMAETLRAAVGAEKERAFVVLIGNYHARRAPPELVFGLPPGVVPPVPTMGHLTDLSMLRVNVGAQAGEFWACMGGVCGAQPARVSATLPGGSGQLKPKFQCTPLDTAGWDAQLRLPRISVAEPAVE